jgi:hypothetical protein
MSNLRECFNGLNDIRLAAAEDIAEAIKAGENTTPYHLGMIESDLYIIAKALVELVEEKT